MRKLLLSLLVVAVPLAFVGHRLATAPQSPEDALRDLVASTAPAALSTSHAQATPRNPGAPLAPTAQEAREAQIVWRLFSDPRFPYRPQPLDAAMSKQIFKRYLDALDADKLFFTQADLDRFAPIRTSLDVAIKAGQLQAPFSIFSTYLKRVDQRVAYAQQLLKHDFDFNAHETWAYDRKDAAWAADDKALDELWRKYVKNDVLRLKLAGKSPEQIRATLGKRYAQVATTAHLLNGEDVFQTFMDSWALSMDPHTDYMDPRTTANFNISMSLSLQGIGAVLQKQDDYVAIRQLMPGGPAMKSGRLKVGDRIVGVAQGDAGEMLDVVGWRIDDVVDKIRGPKGSKVRLEVLPGDASMDAKPVTIALVRDKIHLEEQAAKSRIIQTGTGTAQHKIGVIDLPTFYEDFEGRRKNDPNYASATRDVQKILVQFKAQKVEGVVMDLRDNGGGSLAEAIDLTGLFVGPGPVVQVRDSNGDVNVQSDDIGRAAWSGPLAVLVNRGSASATEIFAAAIQDYGRGLILGENTFGKGSVQNLIDLNRVTRSNPPQFGQVKLTIEQFFRINGASTQIKGVVPDIAFPASPNAKDFGESTYDNALPYTQIKAASYRVLDHFAPIIPRLIALHDARVQANGDREYQWLMQDYAEYREQADKKTLSLNLAERTAERDKDAAKRKEREAERKKYGLESSLSRADDGLDAGERNIADEARREQEAKDRISPLAREAAAILGDAIDLLAADPHLEQAVLSGRAHGAWAN
ncbi:MAG: carboxy terminal-processing peptidase [Proteobacteria bacterium]|nr:carboxy terminal-processing peptidase [Pseudomonadota bacterium]